MTDHEARAREMAREVAALAKLPVRVDANTDDAPAAAVLAAVLHCASCWDGDARLLGNVRARDIFRALEHVEKLCAELLPLLTERDAAREEMERLREEKDGSDEAVVSLMADVERLAAERDTLRQQLTRASATTLELATAVEHLTQTWAEHKATMTALTAALVEAWAEGRAGRGTACALLPTADAGGGTVISADAIDAARREAYQEAEGVARSYCEYANAGCVACEVGAAVCGQCAIADDLHRRTTTEGK